jgi:hydrogenase maturation protease
MGVVVFGIGNLIQGDDGFGVHVLRWLSSHYAFSDQVSLVDGGTAGLGLLPFIGAGDRVLFLDAIDCGRQPGDVLDFEGVDWLTLPSATVSPHDLGLSDLLAAALLTEQAPDEVVVLGVQPGSTSLSAVLSPDVALQVEPIGRRALRTLKAWGVPAIPSDSPGLVSFGASTLQGLRPDSTSARNCAKRLEEGDCA